MGIGEKPSVAGVSPNLYQGEGLDTRSTRTPYLVKLNTIQPNQEKGHAMWFDQFHNGMESRRVTVNGRTFKVCRVKRTPVRSSREGMQFTAVFPSADSRFPRVCPSFSTIR
jgi:hypothetical protein